MNHPTIMLRAAVPEDADALLHIYAPYVEKTAITFEYEVPGREEFSGRIQRTLEKYPYIVACVQDEIVGYAYASAFHTRQAYQWCAETSIYVSQTWKGRGIGKVLYQAMEELLVAQGVLNLNACIAFPAEEDEYLTRDSAAFHEHMGYRLVGTFRQCGYKFGRWYDMIWMEKHIGPHQTHQEPIKTFDEVKHLLTEHTKPFA